MMYVEQNCTFEHAGRKFTAGGAIVTDQYITAYPKERGVLGDWHGNAIGTWRALSSWPVRSYIGSRMYSIECFVAGVRYVGRGFGVGMMLNARRSSKQEVAR